MAYFVEDEKLQGYYVSGGVTINIVKYHFECDDAASLPAQTAFISSKKVKISMASTAHTIDTDALYKMDSSGAWVQQSQPWQPLADYRVLSNKPQINGHTLTGDQSGADLGLQNTLTFDSTPTQSSTNPVTSGGIWTDQQRQDTLESEDRASLVELVDGGDKNKFTKAADSVSSSSPWLDISGLTNILAGVSYVMSFENLESSDTERTTIQIRFSNSSYEFYIQCPKGQNVNVSFTSQQDITAVRIYKSDTYAHGAGHTMSFSGAMICTLADWKISQTFQPYRPSWQEMYDRVSTLDGITPKVVYTNALLVSTGTTMAATGLEYTIAGTSTATYRLTAIGSFNGSQPDELRLVNKVTGSLYGIATRSDVGTNASIIVSGCVATGANITVEVQAKYVSAGNNYIRLIVEKIPIN